jgi:peptidoglycan/xylan/chitin deacetylase (PgdA/CDA1 family)
VLTEEAARYALGELSRRAGLGENTQGLPAGGDHVVELVYGHPKDADTLRPTIFVVPEGDEVSGGTLDAGGVTVEWVSYGEVAPDGFAAPGATLPILRWGVPRRSGEGRLAERRDARSVVIGADLVKATLFMLTRIEETGARERDRYERFPASSSLAMRAGFLDRPIVDEYGMLIRAWARALVQEWEPRGRRPAVRLTHDVDYAWRVESTFSSLREIVGDVLKRRNIRKAVENGCALLADPWLAALDGLSTTATVAGTRATFFVMAASSTRWDSGYPPEDPRVKRRLRRFAEAGHEIGLHASYLAAVDGGLLRAERERLERVVGARCTSVRNHYLRFWAPDTWRRQEGAGLKVDSTLGYADHEGFRAGTCHPYRPFDLERNRVLDVEERPLIVMDGTLRQYRRLLPRDAEDRIRQLADRCAAVEGDFTILWHNTSMTGGWSEWGQLYDRVVRALL